MRLVRVRLLWLDMISLHQTGFSNLELCPFCLLDLFFFSAPFGSLLMHASTSTYDSRLCPSRFGGI